MRYTFIVILFFISSCYHHLSGQENQSHLRITSPSQQNENILDSIKMILSVDGRSFVVLQEYEGDLVIGAPRLIHASNASIWAASQSINAALAPSVSQLEGRNISILDHQNMLQRVELGKPVVLSAASGFFEEWEGSVDEQGNEIVPVMTQQEIANAVLNMSETSWLAIEINERVEGVLAFFEDEPEIWSREEVDLEVQRSLVHQLMQSPIAMNAQQDFIRIETEEQNLSWLESNVTEKRFLKFVHGSEQLMMIQANTLGCGDFSALAVGFYFLNGDGLVPIDESFSPAYFVYSIFSYENLGAFVIAETGEGKAIFQLDSSSLFNDEHEMHRIKDLLIQFHGCSC